MPPTPRTHLRTWPRSCIASPFATASRAASQLYGRAMKMVMAVIMQTTTVSMNGPSISA
ncbi:hypothetical protein [Streptomyces sp. H27-C3]|uniref:hypothetical protein n=1 Tax=Streptomyces sp. H27-C3 TaxID=3046305 RepID=UPI0024BAB2FA|nr:hypothetical protein [Streptomyces sp. H27-C3]MDJ0466885.1 hypothetical protein [Streptomyces sp. H27-C3]